MPKEIESKKISIYLKTVVVVVVVVDVVFIKLTNLNNIHAS